MKLIIRKVPQHIDREIFIKACHFYAEQLIKSQTVRKNTLVIVKFLKTLLTKKQCYGISSCHDTTYNPKEFLIKLDSSGTMDEILSTLAHEFVHVKQWRTGELLYRWRPVCVKWKGKTYFENITPYDDLPWEIEAHNLETILYNNFMETLHVSGDS